MFFSKTNETKIIEQLKEELSEKDMQIACQHQLIVELAKRGIAISNDTTEMVAKVQMLCAECDRLMAIIKVLSTEKPSVR